MKYPVYSEMKDSGIEWLGEIPEHWEAVKLRYLKTNQFLYGANESAELNDRNQPRYIRITDIDSKGLLRKDTYKSLPIEIAKPYLLEEGDILFARSGATVGKTYIYDSDVGDACFAGYLIRYKPNTNKVIPKFIYNFTQTIGYEQWIGQINIQSTIQNVSAERYGNLIISLPPINEQKDIVNFLDHETGRIDQLINKKDQLIKLLHEKRQALISYAVTKGLDPYVPMKDSGIEWLGEVPEHWEVKRLRYYINLNPSYTEINNISDNTEVTFLPMKYINVNGDINFSNVKKLKDVINGFTYFSNGDILLAKITPCFENGKSAIANNLVNNIGFGTTEVHVIRVNNNLNNKYIYYLINSNPFMELGEAEMTGSAGQKRVPSDFINNFSQGIPPLKEQQQIAEYLDKQTNKIDNLTSKIKKQISNLKEYRQALISNAVTGKIDVREIYQNE